MKEIVARGKIEAEALMKYVIDGISEDAQSKIILYEAKKLTEFKEKLKVYEAIRKNTERMKTRENSMPKKIEEANVQCYNCGGKGHKSRDL